MSIRIADSVSVSEEASRHDADIAVVHQLGHVDLLASEVQNPLCGPWFVVNSC